MPLLCHPQAALNAVGERVGRQLAERYSRERAPLLEQLEAVKFVCKEFWGEVFRKVVDNLRTNHRHAGRPHGGRCESCVAGGDAPCARV